MPLPPEVELLLGARDGAARDEAWGAFVKEYSRLLMNVARGVAHDHDGSMDGYTHLLERLREDDSARLRAFTSDGRARFTTWLVVVARRLCIDHHRSRYGRAREGEPQEARAVRRQLHELVGDAIEVDALPGTALPADLELRRAELRGALIDALSRLEPRDRLLVTFRFQDDLAASRIAGLMGFPTAFHVYRRLNKVLARLGDDLRARGFRDATP